MCIRKNTDVKEKTKLLAHLKVFFDKIFQLPVKRTNGCDGRVEVEWYTVEMSAKQGEDYVEESGVVTFENGENEKYIKIQIVQTPDKEPDETFKVVLGKLSDGAQLGHTKETIVTIIGDAEFQNMVNRVVAKTHIALGKVRNLSALYLLDEFDVFLVYLI